MKFGLISVGKDQTTFILKKAASEIPRIAKNIELVPAMMAPPSRNAGPSQVRPSKATRWVVCLAFLVLGIFQVQPASATPALLNSIVAGPNGSPSSVNLAWDPSSGTNVAGYAVYYGTASREYTSRVDVGANLSFTVNGLDPTQTYYFTANAYDAVGDESDFSNEIVVPATDIIVTPPTPTTNIVTVTIPVLSSTNPSGPWQVEAMFTLTYTNPGGNKYFYPGQFAITNAVQ